MVLAMLMVGLLGACSAAEPYVHRAGEFDRQAQGFAVPPTDIGEVTVCYGKYGTNPQAVASVARQECGRINKTAAFKRQSYSVCPAVAPIAAIFECVGSKATQVYGGYFASEPLIVKGTTP